MSDSDAPTDPASGPGAPAPRASDLRPAYERQQRHRRDLQFALSRDRPPAPAVRATLALPAVGPVTQQVPVAVPPASHFRLRADAGIEPGTTFELRVGELGIGRAPDNAVQLDVAAVSSHHASLVVTSDAVTIEDRGSLNGTLVNGVRTDRALPLAVGDRIQLADVVLVLDDAETTTF